MVGIQGASLGIVWLVVRGASLGIIMLAVRLTATLANHCLLLLELNSDVKGWCVLR